MPYLFKLSKRVARIRSRALIVFATAFACEPGDHSMSGPADPSYATVDGHPGSVADLTVSAVTDTSARLSFTEVDDGSSGPASYDVRFALSPLSWGSAPSVTRGTCAVPLGGSAIGARRSCTVLGLSPSKSYQFLLVPFRGTLNVNAAFGGLSNVASGTTASRPPVSECAGPRAGWIWCDDFEQDHLSSYFEYDNAGGAFVRATGVGVGSSTGMRARWATVGQLSAGALHLAVGKTPQAYFRPADQGTAVYRELYWRMYVRDQAGWVGGGADKLSRAMSYASSSSWAQAMIAHVWSGSVPNQDYLVIDPASGTDASGNLITTTYNDFANLRWLGAAQGVTPLFDASHVGQWYCVEAHARLNDAGQANGVFEVWINGTREAQRTGLNWVGSFSAYGINAVYFENYWNAGAPQPEERYFDNIVVSTQPIGCLGSTLLPPPPPPPPPPPAAVAQVSATPASASFNVGQAQRFAATLKDANGNTLIGRAIAWSSSNAAVVTVDTAGLARGVAGGSATISATSGGVTGGAAVTVIAPVASVTVNPTTLSQDAGATLQLSATLKDANGNVLSGRAIIWTSSNPAVATVSGGGLETAVGGGSATITATSEGVSGKAAAGVTITKPGAVSDLTVVAVTDTSATLSFTQVTDGSGQPASYDVRYAVTPLSWGSALSVARGACASSVAGTAIGAKRTCTVPGLSAATGYGFELVPYRGTLNVNAVFGGLSNVATGTTSVSGVPAPAPVASVAVSPATASLTVGQTRQYTATLKDANGNVLSGRSVSWTSSTGTVAGISATGLASGLVAGTSTLTATSEGRSGTATLTVTVLPPPPPPSLGGWANEPGGYGPRHGRERAAVAQQRAAVPVSGRVSGRGGPGHVVAAAAGPHPSLRGAVVEGERSVAGQCEQREQDRLCVHERAGEHVLGDVRPAGRPLRAARVPTVLELTRCVAGAEREPCARDVRGVA